MVLPVILHSQSAGPTPLVWIAGGFIHSSRVNHCEVCLELEIYSMLLAIISVGFKIPILIGNLFYFGHTSFSIFFLQSKWVCIQL